MEPVKYEDYVACPDCDSPVGTACAESRNCSGRIYAFMRNAPYGARLKEHEDVTVVLLDKGFEWCEARDGFMLTQPETDEWVSYVEHLLDHPHDVPPNRPSLVKILEKLSN
jgi:hypothetical protein